MGYSPPSLHAGDVKLHTAWSRVTTRKHILQERTLPLQALSAVPSTDLSEIAAKDVISVMVDLYGPSPFHQREPSIRLPGFCTEKPYRGF